jgi:hypothetical protein
VVAVVEVVVVGSAFGSLVQSGNGCGGNVFCLSIFFFFLTT